MDNRGLLLPRGIYFCTLRTGDVTAKLKLIKVDQDMPVLAGLLYLLLAAPAPASRPSAGLPCSAVPFDVNKVVARTGSPHATGMVPHSLDSTEFMLDTTPNGYMNWAQWDPAVAFNGENYLVVWKDSSERILCARVSQTGTILDPADEVVYNAGSWHTPDVSSDGDGYVAVWDGDGGHRIIEALVSRDGVAADTITVCYSPKQCYSPRVAFNGTDYMVTWYDSRNAGQWNIYACRVNSSGVVLDTQGIKVTTPTAIVPHSDQFPSVASDGQSFLVTWETNIIGPWAAMFSRITGDGVVLDTGGVLLNQEGHTARTPSVAFDGTNYLVTWSGGTGLADIEGKRVSPAGAVLDQVTR